MRRCDRNEKHRQHRETLYSALPPYLPSLWRQRILDGPKCTRAMWCSWSLWLGFCDGKGDGSKLLECHEVYSHVISPPVRLKFLLFYQKVLRQMIYLLIRKMALWLWLIECDCNNSASGDCWCTVWQSCLVVTTYIMSLGGHGWRLQLHRHETRRWYFEFSMDSVKEKEMEKT